MSNETSKNAQPEIDGEKRLRELRKFNAFHGDPKIKEKYVSRVLARFQAGEIVQSGQWTINSDDHKYYAVDRKLYEVEMGIPEWLSYIEDVIFEGLPIERAKRWPVDFLSAIPIGADLEKIKAPFMVFVLEGCYDHVTLPETIEYLDKAISLYKNPNPTPEEHAAVYAPYMLDTVGYSDAICPAYSVENAVNNTATASFQAVYKKFADELLRLIVECK